MIKDIIFIGSILFGSILAQPGKGLQKDQLLPTLEYITLDRKSKEVKWSESQKEVYLIDFWATWCAPCVASIPHMDSLINKFKGEKVKFISITYEPANLVRAFLVKYPMKSEIGIDNDFSMFRLYNGWAIPNIVMVNSKGRFAGRIHPNQLNKEIINLLLEGKIPDVKNTKEDLFDPVKAEEYFKTFLEKQK